MRISANLSQYVILINAVTIISF